jgi:hypothetical protein
MVLGIVDIPVVDDIGDEAEKAFNAGKDWVVDRANDLGDLASDFGDLFVGGVVSFGNAVSEGTGDVLDHIEDLPGEIVEIGGRIIKIIDDGFEGIREDITDAAEGIAWAAEHGAEALAEGAEDLGEAAVDVAVDVAVVAVDAGMWTWEAANYAQTQFNNLGTGLIELGGAVAGEVLHPVLDPILGEQATQDLLDAGVDFGSILATGGEDGLRDFVNQQVAAQAGSLERGLVTEALGEDIGMDAGTITQYGLLRAQGMDMMHAAQAVGIDPTSEVAAAVEAGTADLIGDDGAAAAANFARDLMNTYGQQASDAANRSGMEQYGDRFDPNTTAAVVPHTVGWQTTNAQVEMLTQSGERAWGEVTEALFEPIVGQDAAEVMGEYGPRIGVEVFRTIATGGLSGGQAALTAGRLGFQVATGEEFEDFVNRSVSDEFSGPLGEDGARLLGQLTESGLRLGLNYAAGHAGGNTPDTHITDLNLDDFKRALIDFGVDEFRDLTGVDPEIANRLILHAGNDTWTEQDSDDLLAGIRPFIPDEQQDIYDALVAGANEDPAGALEALRNRLPEPIREIYDRTVAADDALESVLGYNPNAGTPVLDRLGVSRADLETALAADEADRGVDPYEPPAPGEAATDVQQEDVFQSLTAGLHVDPGDPAAPLVAQAVALQDTIALLQTQGGPAAQPAIAQARALLEDLDHQVDLIHPPQEVVPSAATELAAQAQMMQLASDSLDALAAQGGPAAAAAQQAQALIVSAQRAFVDNATDPAAIVAAQNAALSGAMSVVQNATFGMNFAQAATVSGLAQQTTSFLAQAQGHTAAAHGLAPPPAPEPELTQADAEIAQQTAMDQANQLLTAMAATSPMTAGAVQQAQALLTQAHDIAAAGGDPAAIVGAQQAALSGAMAMIQGAGAQSAALGMPQGAVLSQQVTAFLGEAQAHSALANGYEPPLPDPYAIIAGQNAQLQGALVNIAGQANPMNPASMQAAQVAQVALGLSAQSQSRILSVQDQLLEAQAHAADGPDPVETAVRENQVRAADLDDDALADARARAGIPDPVDERAAAHEAAEHRVIDPDLQAAMAAQHEAVDASLQAMQFQGPQGAIASQQAMAALANVQAQMNAAVHAQGASAFTPERAMDLQQQALGQALQSVVTSGAPGAQQAAQQLQTLMVQTQQAAAQLAPPASDLRAHGEVVDGPAAGASTAMAAEDLQNAMATQHQLISQSLAGMMGEGPMAAAMSTQAQAVLAGAQAQITAAAQIRGPGALTPERAMEIQQQALGQALQAVAAAPTPASAAAAQQLSTLMGQSQQAAAHLVETQAAAMEAQTRMARPELDERAAAHEQAVDLQDPGDERAAAHAQGIVQGDQAMRHLEQVDPPEDDFDDDIMATHLRQGAPLAEDGRSDVMARLDPDGDGQINAGIAGPHATAAAEDPMGEMDWQDARGDALTGDAEPAPVPTAATAEPVEAGWQDETPDEPPAPAPEPEPAATPDPEPVAEAPEPVAPIEVPDVPDEPPPPPDVPDEPPPDPEPVTHDDAEWLN